jgi:hypothetical protein
MVERREGVRLATAELRDQRQHGCRLARFARQPPQHHAGVLVQGAGEAGAGEELGGLAIVFRRCAGDDLFEGNGEFVRVEGAAFADFLPWGDDSVPGLHSWDLLWLTTTAAGRCGSARYEW